ncbi:MAG: disulfide bond formation protein B [Alphaproteobacteria bacterium]|nr:disulfide bond formation protein B [Alphaproteobacteria bacterium]
MPDFERLDLSRLVPFAIFAVSAAALANAYTAQYAFDVEPCILCLYQRIPYAVAGVLGLAALVLPRGDTENLWRSWAVMAAGLAFLIGAGIAFYHVGVEQHWWASAAGCGGGGVDNGPATVEELQRMLRNIKPVKACDEVDWTLFGLSMATYNVPASLALAVGSFWGAARIRP